MPIIVAMLLLGAAWDGARAATGQVNAGSQPTGDARLEAVQPTGGDRMHDRHGVVPIAQPAQGPAVIPIPSLEPARPGMAALVVAGMLVMLAIAWRRTRQE